MELRVSFIYFSCMRYKLFHPFLLRKKQVQYYLILPKIMIVVRSLEFMPSSSLHFSEYSADMDTNLTLKFLLDVHSLVVPKAVKFCCSSAAFSPGQVLGQQLPDMSHLSFPTQSPSFICDFHFVVPYGGRR